MFLYGLEGCSGPPFCDHHLQAMLFSLFLLGLSGSGGFFLSSLLVPQWSVLAPGCSLLLFTVRSGCQKWCGMFLLYPVAGCGTQFCTWNSSLLLLPNVLSMVSGSDSYGWRVLGRGNLGCFQAGKIPRTLGGKTLIITESQAGLCWEGP